MFVILKILRLICSVFKKRTFNTQQYDLHEQTNQQGLANEGSRNTRGRDKAPHPYGRNRYEEPHRRGVL